MLKRPLLHGAITESVIGAFFEVYNTLGFGFLEHVYVLAIEQELLDRGHTVGREMSVSVTYKGRELSMQRLDLVVDSLVVVEVKSTLELHKSARRQLLSYLRASSLEVGLLLHFGPEATYERLVWFNASS